VRDVGEAVPDVADDRVDDARRELATRGLTV
jgi:hypothetical protein